MKRDRSFFGRRFFRAIALAACLVISLSGTASATRHYTTTLTDPGRVWLTIGLWGGWADFSADWDVQWVPGANQWYVNKTELHARAENGGICEDSGYCIDWIFTASAKFKDSAGNVLYTLTNPAFGRCWTAITNPDDKNIYRCKSGLITLPASASQVKFTWTLLVKRTDDWLFAWPTVTKTVPL